MSDTGYIKLHRSLVNWRYFTSPNYLLVWIYLLLEAKHKPQKWKDKTIEKGQLVTSVQRISEATGISVRKVRTILNNLKGEELTIKSTNKYSLITILNYAQYQYSELKSDKQTDNQLTNKCQTNVKQMSNTLYNKNDKNDKKEKKYIYKGSVELVAALNDFEEMRKKIKKPLTDRAKQQIVKKLNEISNDEETQIKVLEQSITNCWLSVYPLKEVRQDKVSVYDSSLNKNINEQEEEELLKMLGKA